MIGLDTNVLVRLLTGDDATQQATARAFVERHCTPSEPAFVNRLVVLETVWVLESVYAYSREEIGAAIDALLRTARIEIEGADTIRTTLAAYRSGADFGDALTAASNVALGCSKTVTFDRKAAKKIADFVAL